MQVSGDEVESTVTAHATHPSLKPSEPQHLHELLCALTNDYKYIESENNQSQTSVRFSGDRPQLHDVPAYSRLYGCLPSAIVATNNGWKSVSVRANHRKGN